MGRALTPTEFRNQIKKILPTIEVLEDYAPKTKSIKTKCLVCNTVQDRSIGSLRLGAGCPTCYNKRRKPTTDEFAIRLKEHFGDYIKVAGDYTSATTPMKFRCMICNTRFKNLPVEILRTKYACPHCSEAIRLSNSTSSSGKFAQEYQKYVPQLKAFMKFRAAKEKTLVAELEKNPDKRKAPQVRDQKSFIAKARKVHGDKYSYKRAVYTGWDKGLIITCPDHGDFEQKASVHLSGSGCQRCGSTADTTESFIQKAVEIHGDLYDYSETEYIRSDKPVTIICPEHGPFEQVPNNHLQGYGCAKCGGTAKLSRKELLERFHQVHGDTYNYSHFLRELPNVQTKIQIGCKKHGFFWQKAMDHYNGKGCRQCSSVAIPTRKELLTRFRRVHGKKYNYSNMNYVNSSEPITITCPIHGDFEQLVYVHAAGCGCPKCGKDRTRKSLAQFIEDARDVHGDKYDYSKVNYINGASKVEIICPKHGSFWQSAGAHINSGNGCPECGKAVTTSKVQFFLADLLGKKLGVKPVLNYRMPGNGKEIDIYFPDYKVGVEVNGAYWHSSLHKESNYHSEKTRLAKKSGIYLYQFWDFEIYEKAPIIASMVRNRALGPKKQLFARKLHIEEISARDARDFYTDNHLQGACPAKHHIALVAPNSRKVACVMSFIKARFNQNYEWELARFANHLNVQVIGGASRLLRAFERLVNPASIVSYADLRYSDGGLYETLGFEMRKKSDPLPFYVRNAGELITNRQIWSNDLKRKMKYDPEEYDSIQELLQEEGWLKVYDCGKLLYVKEYH